MDKDDLNLALSALEPKAETGATWLFQSGGSTGAPKVGYAPTGFYMTGVLAHWQPLDARRRLRQRLGRGPDVGRPLPGRGLRRPLGLPGDQRRLGDPGRVRRLAGLLRRPRGHRHRRHPERAAALVRPRPRRGDPAAGAAQGPLARRGVAPAARRRHRRRGAPGPAVGDVRQHRDLGGRHQHPRVCRRHLPHAAGAARARRRRRRARLHHPEPGHAQPGAALPDRRRGRARRVPVRPARPGHADPGSSRLRRPGPRPGAARGRHRGPRRERPRRGPGPGPDHPAARPRVGRRGPGAADRRGDP